MRKIWERRKGMSKKKIAAGIGCVVLVVAAVTFVAAYTRKNGTVEALKENQRYVYAYVSNIEGNEITYTELEESVVTEYLAKQKSEMEESETAEADAARKAEENGNGREKNTDRELSMGGGEDAADRELVVGEAEEEQPPQDADGGMPEDRMKMSAETATMLIPVGTTVHTADDTKTTFQRLADGDLLKLLVETGEDGEEVITEIWMLS